MKTNIFEDQQTVQENLITASVQRPATAQEDVLRLIKSLPKTGLITEMARIMPSSFAVDLLDEIWAVLPDGTSTETAERIFALCCMEVLSDLLITIPEEPQAENILPDVLVEMAEDLKLLDDANNIKF